MVGERAKDVEMKKKVRIEEIKTMNNFLVNYTVEFKFDGLGVELVYEDGKLSQ